MVRDHILAATHFYCVVCLHCPMSTLHSRTGVTFYCNLIIQITHEMWNTWAGIGRDTLVSYTTFKVSEIQLMRYSITDLFKEVSLMYLFLDYFWRAEYSSCIQPFTPETKHLYFIKKTHTRRLTAHCVVMQKPCALLLSSVNWEKTKSNECRGNIESISSNPIRRIIHRPCHAWLQANEMDTCCPTFNCEPLLGNPPALKPRHVSWGHRMEVLYLEKS